MKVKLLTVDHSPTSNLPAQGTSFLMATVSFERASEEGSTAEPLPDDVRLMGWPVVAMPFSAARPNTWVGQVLLSGHRSVIHQACDQFRGLLASGGTIEIK